MAAKTLTVSFVGGVYDGEVARIPAQCSFCGRPLGVTGAVLADPVGELWRIERVDGSTATAVHVDDADQLSLDELLGGAA